MNLKLRIISPGTGLAPRVAGSNCQAFSGGDGGSREKLAGGAALQVTIELAND